MEDNSLPLGDFGGPMAGMPNGDVRPRTGNDDSALLLSFPQKETLNKLFEELNLNLLETNQNKNQITSNDVFNTSETNELTQQFEELSINKNTKKENNIIYSNKNEKILSKKNQKKNHYENETLKIVAQNIRSIKDPYKKEYCHHLMNKENIDVLILTETWEENNCKNGIERTFTNCKTIVARGNIDENRGQGLACIIRYPLAQQVQSFRSIRGRVLNLVLKRKKKSILSIYAIQAPTAPYGAGKTETIQLAKDLRKMLNADLANGNKIIVVGDLNSYPNRTIDYKGNASGHEPSDIIVELKNMGLVDVFRIFYCYNEEFTFKTGNMASRLDHFWISPQLVKQVENTSIMPFEETVSDHAAILLNLNWKYKKSPSQLHDRTFWNNKFEDKVLLWSSQAERICDRIMDANTVYDNSNFEETFDKLAKEFKRHAKKIFWIKKRRKRNSEPPIWLYIMRRIRKAQRHPNNLYLSEYALKLLSKYFPEINCDLSFDEIRIELKSAAQKLLAAKVSKQMQKAIKKRFYSFGTNISIHLDNILERKAQRIDTSFVKDGENIICDKSIVRTEFFNYYKKLFGNTEAPLLEEEDEIESTGNVSHEILEPEFMSVLARIANNKAAGISGMIIEMVKNAGNKFLTWLLKQFNEWLRLSEVPKVLLKSQIWLIPKGSYDGDIQNTRPINLIEVLRKLFSSILVERINLYLAQDGILRGNNFGFMPGKCTSDAIKILQFIKSDAQTRNKPLIVIYLDIRKAYDSVNPLSVDQCVRKIGLDSAYRNILKYCFDNRKMRIITQAGYTDFFHPITGLEQGDPSSPILWNIFYEPLLRKLNELNGYKLGNTNISYLCYADDLTLIATNDNDMQALLNEVENYLETHKMKIQPKKSVMVSNYASIGFEITENEMNNSIATNGKKELITYLGVPMPLNESKEVGLSILNEVKEIVAHIGNKRISSCIASYIVNNVILPIVAYRLNGRAASQWLYKQIDKQCCGIVKRAIRIPSSFPHSLLRTTILPIRVRSIKDYHEEQECNNIMYWLNAEGLIGNVTRERMQFYEKCHPIFSGSIYKTKSCYLNWIWKLFIEKGLVCTSMETMNDYKNGIYTCQYLETESHDRQAKILPKYGIEVFTSLLQHSSRGNLKFKSFEMLASGKEKELGLELPDVITELFEKEQELITKFKNKSVTILHLTMEELVNEILNSLPSLEPDEQDFDTVFTDGSFDKELNEGGAAAIIIRNNGEHIKVSKYLPVCSSSSHAEVVATLLGFIVAKKYSKVISLKTDSSAIMHSLSHKLIGRKIIKEQFRLWLNQIRSLRNNMQTIRVEWVKAHSNIVGNEIADGTAKEARISKQNLLRECIGGSDSTKFYLWQGNQIVDENVREFIKKKNIDKRNKECFYSNSRMSQFIRPLTELETDVWKQAICKMHNFFNSSFERENLIRFLLKGFINILPTGTNLKQWRILESSECLSCHEEENIEHILEARCARNDLTQEIDTVIDKMKLPKNYILTNGTKLKELILRKWNFKHALGVIDEEIIEEIKKANLIMEEIVALSKLFMKIGLYLWKTRCSFRMRSNCSLQDIPNSSP